MKISHGIEYVLFRIMAGIFQLLPHPIAVNLGDRIGRAVCNLWKTRHDVVIRNLGIAFGDAMPAAEKEVLARNVFGNIGKTLAEVCRFSRLSQDKIRRLVSSEGEDCFQEAFDHGKGAVLVGSHFGNWELMGIYINDLGFPVDFLVRGQHNHLVDEYLTRLRVKCGVGVLHSERSMKDVVRALKNNRQVAIVSDQHEGSRGLVIEFFGHPVSVPRAPAQLAVKLGSPIITGYILRNPDNSHHCIFDKPEYPDPDADPDHEIVRLTKLYTQRIESTIRKYPELWLWTHRRFKSVKQDETDNSHA
jgi:KDO2-lipid IV(A) lauroyltransferase